MLTSFRNYLHSAFRTQKPAELLYASSDLVFEQFIPQFINRFRDMISLDINTIDDLKNIIWHYGHELTGGSPFLETRQYLRRQADTVSNRILKKSTIDGYNYLFYIYNMSNFLRVDARTDVGSDILTNIASTIDLDIGAEIYGKGIPLGTILLSKNDNIIKISNPVSKYFFSTPILVRNDGVYPLVTSDSPIASLKITRLSSIIEYLTPEGITLDDPPDEEFILDQDEDNIIQYDPNTGNPIYDNPQNNGQSAWYLDRDDVLNVTTRHFLVTYQLNGIETTTEFFTKLTLGGFYKDLLQIKRKLEIPHFEPQLILNTPLGLAYPNTAVEVLYKNEADSSINFTSVAQAFTLDLSVITHIQFGTGKRTLLDAVDISADALATGIVVASPFVNEYSYFDNSTASPKFLNPLRYEKSYQRSEILEIVPSIYSINSDWIDLVSWDATLEVGNGIYNDDFPKDAYIVELDQPNVRVRSSIPPLTTSNKSIAFNRGLFILNVDNEYKFPINYFNIESLSPRKFILRTYVFPYSKWSGFSEFALFAGTTCVYYAYFPRIQYFDDMLSSIYINVNLVDYVPPQEALKYTLNFVTSNWTEVLSGVDAGSWQIQVPLDLNSVPVDTFPNPIHASGYDPYIFIFSNTSGTFLDVVSLHKVFVDLQGTVTIMVSDMSLVFDGKLILF